MNENKFSKHIGQQTPLSPSGDTNNSSDSTTDGSNNDTNNGNLLKPMETQKNVPAKTVEDANIVIKIKK